MRTKSINDIENQYKRILNTAFDLSVLRGTWDYMEYADKAYNLMLRYCHKNLWHFFGAASWLYDSNRDTQVNSDIYAA